MKFFYATIIALTFISFLIPQNLTAQSSNDDHDWDFVDRFDDTEDVSPEDINRRTILMPNPLISGASLQILMPSDLEVNLKEVKVFDAKGSLVSAAVSKDQRHLRVATQRLSSGVYFIQITQAIKKKFVVQ